jgi:hypothetical protein
MTRREAPPRPPAGSRARRRGDGPASLRRLLRGARAGPRRGLLATSKPASAAWGQPHHNRRDSVQAHATQSLVTTDQLRSNLECEHRIVL